MEDPPLTIEVRGRQADELADTDARGVDQHHESAVPWHVRVLEQRRDLRPREDLGSAVLTLERGHSRQADDVGPDELVEEFQGTDGIVRVAKGIASLVDALDDVSPDPFVRFRDAGGHCFQELTDVVTVGVSGTIRVAAEGKFLFQALQSRDV